MSSRSAEHWDDLEAILDEAIERALEERDDYLDRACGSDPDLCQAVEAVLRAGDRALRFLEGQVLAFALPLLVDVEGSLDASFILADQRVGPYRLLQKVGRGGMGVVYRAERVGGPFEQEVAVKLLPPGHRSEAVQWRFDHEQRVLAMLNHSHIVCFYDGGNRARRVCNARVSRARLST